MFSRTRRYILIGVVVAGLSIELPSAVLQRANAAPPTTVGFSAQAPATTDADWRIAGHIPHPRIRPAVTAGRDGNVYVFGGMDSTNGYNVFNTTYIYNPHTNTWARGADMAVGREGAQAVTLPDGRIIVLGGSPGCPNSSSAQLCFSTSRVDMYNPRTNQWRSLAPMQTPRYRFNAVLRSGEIYAIGGLNGVQPLASVEVYSPKSNRWYDGPDLPHAIEGSAAAADNHGHIYVMGGAPAAPPTFNTLYIFDGQGWQDGPPMPQAAQDFAAAYDFNGKIYAIGGWDLVDLTTVQVYNPKWESWSTAPTLPSPLCCMGAATAPDGSIYSVGGDTTNRLFAYRPVSSSVKFVSTTTSQGL